MHPILQVLNAQKRGRKIGIYSCCSANEYVWRAALLSENIKEIDIDSLIETGRDGIINLNQYVNDTVDENDDSLLERTLD